jgi:predicted MPP superfamily phosphohydrolase
MIISKRLSGIILISAVLSSSFFVGSYIYAAMNARAVLISPRLGAPLCASASDGSWDSTPLENNIRIMVGIEPYELLIPLDWMEPDNWNISIAYSALDNTDLIDLTIVSIAKVFNSFSSLGIDDTSIWIKNAIEIELRIPSQIDSCLYDIYIGFKMDLHTITERIIDIGSYFSETVVGIASTPFLIAEQNAVYVPFDTDATPEDPQGSDPFSLIHISDVHASSNLLGEWTNKDKMQNLGTAMSIWAPDVIVETGDITNAPGDYPIEYQIAYNYFVSLGIPLIINNGNHDQGNLGLWKQYFGSTFSDVNWMGAHFIQINTATSLNGKAVNWIASLIKQYQNTPTFLNCHIPLVDINARQNQGYSAVLMDAMVTYGGTAVLQGHNHYDMIMDADKALPIYRDLIKSIQTALEDVQFSEACHIPSRVGNSAPSGTGTKLIITTSGGKDERGSNLRENDLWPEYMGHIGYRRITLAENTIINYTYDKNGDGIRDPSYSTPLWALNGTLDFDIINPEFGANYTITNNLTEGIDSARVTFTLPLVVGCTWAASASMGVEGVDYQLRYTVSNATHQFFEYRIPVPKRININTPSIVEFKMELIV